MPVHRAHKLQQRLPQGQGFSWPIILLPPLVLPLPFLPFPLLPLPVFLFLFLFSFLSRAIVMVTAVEWHSEAGLKAGMSGLCQERWPAALLWLLSSAGLQGQRCPV